MDDKLLSALQNADGDGGVLLDDFAEQSYEQPSGTKFSYVRDDVAIQVTIDPRYPDVKLNPMMRSGRPTIAGHNIHIATLAGMVLDGDPVSNTQRLRSGSGSKTPKGVYDGHLNRRFAA